MPTSKPDAKKSRQIEEILKAIRTYDLTQSSAWADLDALSSNTVLDGVEVDPAGIIIKGKEFWGPVSVYLVLKYTEANEENFETSDSFRGEFVGHFENTELPVIDHVTVDTSPFFEGESAP